MNKANNTTILILIFLFFFNTQGNLNQNDTIVISLGRACGVAGTLREYNLRNEAYPFD